MSTDSPAAPAPAPRPRAPELADRVLSVVAVLIPAIVFAHETYRASDFYVDDSFITLRFARNLARGHGFVYNPGGPAVEGFSNPLLVFFQAAMFGAHLDPIECTKYLGAIASLVLGAATVALARLWLRAAGLAPGPESPISRAAPLAGLGFLAGTATLQLGAITGLETNLFAALVTAAFWAASRVAILPDPRARPPLRRPGVWCAGLLVALLPFTRPEGLLWAPAIAIAAILLSLRGGNTRALSSPPVYVFAASVAAILALLAWRISIFDRLLPNTFYAKTSAPLADRLRDGFVYLRPWFLGGMGALQLALAVPALALLPRGARAPAACGLAAVLAQLALAASEGGDWMPGHRLVAPSLGILAALVALGLALILHRIAARLSLAPARAALIGALVAVLATAAAPYALRAQHQQDFREAYTRLMGWESGHRPLGEWLATWRAQRGGKLKVALDDIGLVGWISGAEIIDLAGLVDPVRALELYYERGNAPYHVDYLIDALRPDAIVLISTTHHAGPYGVRIGWKPDKEILASPNFRNTYALFTTFEHKDFPGDGYFLVLFLRKDQLPLYPPPAVTPPRTPVRPR